eukprot:12492918-Alexandrium_andersonii.AAC.1
MQSRTQGSSPSPLQRLGTTMIVREKGRKPALRAFCPFVSGVPSAPRPVLAICCYRLREGYNIKLGRSGRAPTPPLRAGCAPVQWESG